MDPQLVDYLKDMRVEATDRHIEVVQRLTALEKASAPIEKIEDRVRALEGWRAKIVGGLIVGNLLAASAWGWVQHRLK